MNKPRVLLSTHTFPPRHRAGVENYVLRLGLGLQAAGAEVAVLTTDDGPGDRRGRAAEREIEGLHTFVIGDDRVVGAWGDSLGRRDMTAAALGVVRQWQPQIVHHHHFMYVGARWVAGIRELGLPQVLTLHDYWLLCARLGQLRDAQGERCSGPGGHKCGVCLSSHRRGRGSVEARLIAWGRRLGRPFDWDPLPILRGISARTRRNPSAAGDRIDAAAAAWIPDRQSEMRAAWEVMDNILSPSRCLVDRFEMCGWATEEVQLRPYGIDPRLFVQRGDAPPEGGCSPLRLGWFGSMVRAKGPDLAVAALRELPAGVASLVLRGREDHEPAFMTGLKASAGASSAIEFGAAFDAQSAPSAYGALDALIVSSRWDENAPIVISEARAAGLPVIGSDVPGIREMIEDGVDGLIFPEGDSAGLAAAIRRLAGDPGLYQRLRAGVKAPPTTDEDAAAHLRIYAEALRHRERRPAR